MKICPGLHVRQPLKSIVAHVSHVEKQREGTIVSLNEREVVETGFAVEAVKEMVC